MESVTWEYYNSHFPKLIEGQFDKLIYKAQRLVEKRITKAELSKSELVDINDCICNVVNLLDVVDKTAGISSVSNDGYSESYEKSDALNASIDTIINEWIGYLTDVYVGF